MKDSDGKDAKYGFGRLIHLARAEPMAVAVGAASRMRRGKLPTIGVDYV